MVSKEQITKRSKDLFKRDPVSPGKPKANPTTTLRINIITQSAEHQVRITRNFAKTVEVRGMGNAIRSLIVRSEYSLPKTQLVTKPKSNSPPTRCRCSQLNSRLHLLVTDINAGR